MPRRKFISGIALTGAGLALGKVLNATETFGGTGGIRGWQRQDRVNGIKIHDERLHPRLMVSSEVEAAVK